MSYQEYRLSRKMTGTQGDPEDTEARIVRHGVQMHQSTHHFARTLHACPSYFDSIQSCIIVDLLIIDQGHLYVCRLQTAKHFPVGMFFLNGASQHAEVLKRN